jgi:tetratricopeptide (TPR) repeat protein
MKFYETLLTVYVTGQLAFLPCAVAQEAAKIPPPSPAEISGDSRFRPEYISGLVVMENGTSPAKAVIELECSGTVTREAMVAPDGNFRFRFGDSSQTGQVSFDLSQGITDPLVRDSERSIYDTDSQSSRSIRLQRLTTNANRLEGCSLRAALNGYISNSVQLGPWLTSIASDIGTITLFPLEKVRGVSISATSMLAPKQAKNELEKAGKALRKNNAAEGEKLYKSATEIYPKYAEAWFQLGRLYQKQQRNKEAEDAYSKAIESDRLYVNPYVGLAWILSVEQEWQEVVDRTEEALALDPITYPELYYLSAMANFNLKDMVLAQERAQKLEQLNAAPRFPKIYLILAAIFDSMNNNAGSTAQLQEYLKFAPDAPDADLIRAKLKDRLGAAPDK